MITDMEGPSSSLRTPHPWTYLRPASQTSKEDPELLDSVLFANAPLALTQQGRRAGRLGRLEEVIEAYDEVLSRFGEDPEPGTSEAVDAARSKGLIR